MTNDELITQLQTLVKQERRITHEILILIKESEARKLYAERGYPSAFEWLVKEFGYSNAAAYRRIQAARFLASAPEVAEKIQSGEVNLTTLAKVQTVIRNEEKRTQVKIAPEIKVEVLQQLKRKNTFETEQVLANFFPEAVEQKQEKLTATSGDSARLTVNLSTENLKDLERVRELLSHSVCGASWADLISHLAKEFLKRNDPLQKPAPLIQKNTEKPIGKTLNAKSNSMTQIASAAKAVGVRENEHWPNANKVKSQSIPVSLKRAVYQRDGGRCQFKDFKTGKTCGSRDLVEIDHIMPKALGGEDSLENLRCLCHRHNLLMAERNLGMVQANKWKDGRGTVKKHSMDRSPFYKIEFNC